MKRAPWVVALAFVLSIAFLAACSEDSNPVQTMVSGASAAVAVEEGRVRMSADPEEIVIDLGDPNTPTDPPSGKAFGESTITARIVDEVGEPEAGVDVVFETDGGTLKSGGQPIKTDENGEAGDVLVVFVDDPDEIQVQGTVDEDSGVVTVTKTVVLPNRPPVADAGEDQGVECGDPVLLDGSGSSDPDSTEGTNDDIVKFEWWIGTRKLGEGETLRTRLPFGDHTITLKVTDSEDVTDSDDTRVNVVDTTPPEVSLTLEPAELWPPNHKMRDIWARVSPDDRCSRDPRDFDITLISVESNEPPNANGDGNTEPDIMGVEPGREDYSFMLRAERSGPGSGRVYTIIYKVEDDAGNERIVRGAVRVPHDQGH